MIVFSSCLYSLKLSPRSSLYPSGQEDSLKFPLAIGISFPLKIWLNNLFMNFDTTPKEIQKTLGSGAHNTGIVRRWLSYEHAAGPVKVNQINDFYEGSRDIYFHPIFRLLNTAKFKKNELESLMQRFTIYIEQYDCWEFPSNSNKSKYSYPNTPIRRDDYETLVDRGDSYGFMGLLYNLRAMPKSASPIRYYYFIPYIYQAFPGFCRSNNFKLYWYPLLQALDHLVYQFPGAHAVIRPRVDTIFKQITSKHLITYRARRPLDSSGIRAKPLEATYEIASFPSDTLKLNSL